MLILEKFATSSDCYRVGRRITVRGLMLHSVGCPQPNPNRFYENWNKPGASACVHAVIGPNEEVIQLLPWDMRGWHCGGAGNDAYIGIEMTEPAYITYTKGSNWNIKEGHTEAEMASFVRDTYNTAVKVFSELCKRFGLDPQTPGTILSHAEAHAQGIASNHGDVEHIWRRFGITMDEFRSDVAAALANDPGRGIIEGTPLQGEPVATEYQASVIMSQEGVSPQYLSLIPTYFAQGRLEGIRGDIALAQSCLETGWFTFPGDVKPTQNNFAGIGATGGGVRGNSFSSPEEGVTAQIQHLKAYASDEPLKGSLVDPRFSLVKRGSAPTLELLSIPKNPEGSGWAADPLYAEKITAILSRFLSIEGVSSSPPGQQEEDPNPPEDLDNSGETETLYRVRESRDNAATQLGAFSILSNAIALAQKNQGYQVYDQEGTLIYPPPTPPDPTPSPEPTPTPQEPPANEGEPFQPYKVKVLTALNVRSAPGGRIVMTIRDNGVYTIIGETEDGKWGELLSGAGWISLSYTRRL